MSVSYQAIFSLEGYVANSFTKGNIAKSLIHFAIPILFQRLFKDDFCHVTRYYWSFLSKNASFLYYE